MNFPGRKRYDCVLAGTPKATLEARPLPRIGSYRYPLLTFHLIHCTSAGQQKKKMRSQIFSSSDSSSHDIWISEMSWRDDPPLHEDLPGGGPEVEEQPFLFSSRTVVMSGTVQ
jgi:hypothetical protein